MTGRTRLIAGSLALLGACPVISVGCGDDDDTESTESPTAAETSDTAQQRIDSAVESCTTNAQELGDAAGAALEAACTTVGDDAKQALASGGDQVEQALSQAADSCQSAVTRLPAGDAQNALSDLCAAISG